MTADRGGLVARIRREFHAHLLVETRHPPDGAVQHHRKPRARKRHKDFLGLAQGITKQDRNAPGGESLRTEGQDPRDRLGRRREPVMRQPVGGLHDQGVRLHARGRLAGKTGPELEIPRVEKAAATLLDQHLGRSQDMARGQECRPEIPEIPGLAVAEDMMHLSRGSETRLHEACRGLREDCPQMMARVVAVRVRDEG